MPGRIRATLSKITVSFDGEKITANFEPVRLAPPRIRPEISYITFAATPRFAGENVPISWGFLNVGDAELTSGAYRATLSVTNSSGASSSIAVSQAFGSTSGLRSLVGSNTLKLSIISLNGEAPVESTTTFQSPALRLISKSSAQLGTTTCVYNWNVAGAHHCNLLDGLGGIRANLGTNVTGYQLRFPLGTGPNQIKTQTLRCYDQAGSPPLQTTWQVRLQYGTVRMDCL